MVHGSSLGSGGGAITPPGSSTDNAIVRFDGAGGATLQNSGVTITDAGNIVLASLATVDGRDVSVDGAKLDGLPASAYATVGVDSSSQTQRGRINLIGGTGVSLTASDNSDTNSTDVTLASSHLRASATGTVTTTNNTQTTAATIAVPSSPDPTSGWVHARFSAVRSAGTAGVGYERTCAFRRSGSTVTLIGVGVGTGGQGDVEDAALSTCDATLDVSGTDIRARVTGMNAETLNWRVTMLLY